MKRGGHFSKHRYTRPLLVGAGIGFFCALAATAGVFSSWSARVSDLFFTSSTPDPSIVIVTIDDASISRIGRWPWDRSVHAALIRKLANAGATVIGYDVNFPEPQDATADADLASAISMAHRFVLPFELHLVDQQGGRMQYDGHKTVQAIAEIGDAATIQGFSNVVPDADGIVRRLPAYAADAYAHAAQGTTSPSSFALAIASVADRTPDTHALFQQGANQAMVRFIGSPHTGFKEIRAADVLSDAVDLTQLRNKIVLVGSTAADLHDEQLVPTSNGIPMPGIEIHASILNSLLKQNWLVLMPEWERALFLLFIGVLIGWIVPRMRARWSVLICGVGWIALVVMTSVSFDRGLVVDLFWPTLTILLAYGGVTLERRVSADQRRKWLKQLLARYVSPTIVSEILRDPDQFHLGGERRRMTVLFSDIRGFTPISEQLSPETLVGYLNVYFKRMTDVVFKHGGVLDKYLGDGLMAFWNAPLDQPNHARHACVSALEMREALHDMNRNGLFGRHAFRSGIGIDTGDMVVGNIGSVDHTDYTVIGDHVNLASRLENLTKRYGSEIIISEATRAEAGDAIVARRLDRVAVKGKMKSVLIYDVIALADRISREDRERVAAYESAFDLYLARKFKEAIALCETLMTRHPDDTAFRLLREHASYLIENPPPDDWDGTWVWTRK